MRKTVASGPKTPRIHDQVQLSVVGCRAESAQVRLGNVPRVPHAPDLPARRASPTSAFGHRAMMAASMPPDATAFTEDKALMTGLPSKPRGPVDQLEDRYLGMVEAVGSNPPRSTLHGFASGPEQPLERVAKSRRAHRDNGSCHRAEAARRPRRGAACFAIELSFRSHNP